jgi:hypothetical protein
MPSNSNADDNDDAPFPGGFQPGDRIVDYAIVNAEDSGTWTLRCWPSEPLDDDTTEQWFALIEDAFIQLGRTGALRGVAIESSVDAFPDECQCFTGDDGCLEWEFGRVHVDALAVNVLVNLVEYGAYTISDMLTAEIASNDASLRSALTSREFPTVSNSLPFSVEFIDGAFEYGLRITITFVAPPDVQYHANILAITDSWMRAVEAGAFTGAQSNPGVDANEPDTPPVTINEDTFTWRFASFSSEPAAVDCLLNAYATLHERGCHIASIVIE